MSKCLDISSVVPSKRRRPHHRGEDGPTNEDLLLLQAGVGTDLEITLQTGRQARDRRLRSRDLRTMPADSIELTPRAAHLAAEQVARQDEDPPAAAVVEEVGEEEEEEAHSSRPMMACVFAIVLCVVSVGLGVGIWVLWR